MRIPIHPDVEAFLRNKKKEPYEKQQDANGLNKRFVVLVAEFKPKKG
jgi:hypothetical protein